MREQIVLECRILRGVVSRIAPANKFTFTPRRRFAAGAAQQRESAYGTSLHGDVRRYYTAQRKPGQV